MRQPLTKKPDVGDTIHYVGDGYSYLTRGAGYMVRGVDSDGDIIIMDDDADREYIPHNMFHNFEIEEDALEDPGYFEVHELFEADEGQLGCISVTVDRRGYDLLMKLEEDHNKATKAMELEARIAQMQAELNDIKGGK